MSETDKQMPQEIWTDINGHATRTQFNGGVRYIRAAEYDALREQNRVLVKALDDIRKKSYEPDSERPDRLSTRAQIQLMAEAALTATSQEGQHG